MISCRFAPHCDIQLDNDFDVFYPCIGDGADTCASYEPYVDRNALLALAEVISTPEVEADCGTCPLRKWCEEARDSGSRITCFECRLWHTADAIREACGEGE